MTDLLFLLNYESVEPTVRDEDFYLCAKDKTPMTTVVLCLLFVGSGTQT